MTEQAADDSFWKLVKTEVSIPPGGTFDMQNITIIIDSVQCT
jgi:hypothetical protein